MGGIQAYMVGDRAFALFTTIIEEADTTFQEILEIRYDEESKHDSNSGEYEIQKMLQRSDDNN